MNDEWHLQRVTAPGYLQALDSADATQIRAMRDECRAAEHRLSYLRRVLQGQLDVALAEVARRKGVDHGPLVTRVAHALVGPAGAARSTRAVGLYDPSDGADDVTLDAATTQLPDMDAAALNELVARLRRRERALSDQRGTLLAHLDRLQEALVARYRDDQAEIDAVASTLEGS